MIANIAPIRRNGRGTECNGNKYLFIFLEIYELFNETFTLLANQPCAVEPSCFHTF